MITDKILSAKVALSTLAGTIGEEQWQLVRCVQHTLEDAAHQTRALETTANVNNCEEEICQAQ